jgi:5-formyltetrahydrofolate cyclo-ligase
MPSSAPPAPARRLETVRGKPLLPDKDALRARCRLYRQALGDDAYGRRSAAIVERARDVPALAQAQTVHVYWPQVSAGEVDTRPLVDALHEAGRTAVLPVVTSFERGAPALEHRRYAGRAALTANRWGLAEPSGTQRVDPAALDAVVVPAFAAGRNGHRVGHGFGYYDAFLAGLEVPTVGLVYDACLVPHVPADAHDVALNTIVTETETVALSSTPPRASSS